LTVAAVLPVHLYLAHYLSNDLLAGALATLAVYLSLGILREESPGTFRLAALGAALGATVMTKLTGAPVAAVVLAVLAGRLAARRDTPRAWLRVIGVPLLVCL